MGIMRKMERRHPCLRFAGILARALTGMDAGEPHAGCVRSLRQGLLAGLVLCVVCASAFAQRKQKAPPKPSKPLVEQPQSEIAKLRDEYVKTTKEYKASLQKLLGMYEGSLKKAEDKRDQAQKLTTAIAIYFILKGKVQV